MNKFNEFDLIKTPKNWIDEALVSNHQPTKKTFKIKYAYIIILIVTTISIFTLGITYAFSSSFRTWLNEQFNNQIKISTSLDFAVIDKANPMLRLDYGHWRVENEFFGMVDENDHYTKLYTLNNEEMIECDINDYLGKINNHEFSFKYVMYQNRILGFDFSGCVYNLLPKIIDNEIYVCVDINGDNNVAKISLDSNKVNFITNDNISVNPIASPNQTNILINKNNQEWVNYNLETGKTKLIKNVDPYIHNNCITFIDENNIITYDENSKPFLINILSNEINYLDNVPLEGTVVNVEYDSNKIKFTNIINNNYLEINGSAMGSSCNSNFIVLFNDQKIILYDIEKNSVSELNYDNGLDEKLKDVMIINQSHLLVVSDQSIYLVVSESNTR